MVTIKDVARSAKVSIATVSHVLSDSGRVGDDTRKRVKQAAAELGYRPNLIARSLKSRRTHTVGMVISDITNPFFPELVRGAEDAAMARGYTLTTFNTDDRPDRERHVFDVLHTRRVDGILVVVALERAPLPHIEEALSAGTPVVCLDRHPQGIAADAVKVDNSAGVESAVRHLVERGYSQIAYIGGASNMYIAPERLKGYLSAMRKAALPTRIVYGDFRRDSGYHAAIELFAAKPRPDAVFIANLMMTLGALEGVRTLGLSVPDHLGMANFDSIELLRGFRPELTSVVQPNYEIGYQGANLLLDRIEGQRKGAPVVIKLPCQLRIGESSRQLK